MEMRGGTAPSPCLAALAFTQGVLATTTHRARQDCTKTSAEFASNCSIWRWKTPQNNNEQCTAQKKNREKHQSSNGELSIDLCHYIGIVVVERCV
jgi:hypothetical protein